MKNKKISIKKIFTNTNQKNNIKSAFLNAIYYQIMGVLLCLLTLYALTGGKNYIKLYKELNKVIDTYDTITQNNYSKVDKKELSDIAVNAMLESINDEYTNYSNEEEATTFLENVEGQYEGIGITVKTDKEGKIIIVEVFDNSPAKSSGLKENDIIKKVDEINLKEKDRNYLANYIKNNKNKKIKLTIIRNQIEKEITITPNQITVPTVSSKIIDEENKIGYINMTIFSSVTEDWELKYFHDVIVKKLEEIFRGRTLVKIEELFARYRYTYSFNRSNVAELFGVTENRASGILKTCVDKGIIIKHKNGVYYFVKQ